MGGAGELAVPAVPVAYNDGGQTQRLVADMTILSSTQNAQAQYDNKVTIKGGRRRSKRSSSCRRRKGSRKGSRKGNRSKRSKRSKRRISRRHR